MNLEIPEEVQLAIKTLGESLRMSSIKKAGLVVSQFASTIQDDEKLLLFLRSLPFKDILVWLPESLAERVNSILSRKNQ